MPIRTSAANGAWNSVGSWDTGIPVDGDIAVINHDIYIDSDVTVGTGASGETNYAVTINSGGILRWANPPSGNWLMTVKGSIWVKSGGTLRVGTVASPLSGSYKADIFFAPTGDNYYWRIYVNDGVLDLNGSPSYHMGSTSMQRAKLVGNISAGAGVAFVLDRDADWQVNDYVAIGCGGDKTYYPTPTTHRPEKVQITGKTDARHFTATFAYDHKTGDHLISLERNVVVRGNGNLRGFRIQADHGSSSGAANTRLRATWAAFRYCGNQQNVYTHAAISWMVRPNSPTQFHVSDAFLAKNLVFDTSGVESGYASPNDFADAYAIGIYTNIGFSAVDCIQDINAFSMGKVVHVQEVWELELSRIVGIGTGRHTIYMNAAAVNNISADDVWCCARNWECTYSIAFYGEFIRMDNVECFNAYKVREAMGGGTYSSGRHAWQRMLNWKVWSIYSYGFEAASVVNLCFESMEARQFRQPAIYFSTGGGNVLLQNCSFDGCNLSGYNSGGAIQFQGFYYGKVLFHNCSFGTAVRNNYHNVIVGSGSGTQDNQSGRFKAEGCVFVEPTNWSSYVGSYKYYNNTQLWSVHFGDYGDWRYRIAVGSRCSIELADCQVLTLALADQWVLDYPGGVRQIARVCGGSEMIDEPTVKLDGTFCRQLLPFHPTEQMQANEHYPIPIPVVAGQTVTVKLSMRKTKDGLMGLPGIRLEGPGILSEDEMSAGLLDTWEELTVSGVAASDGTCYLIVLGGTNNCYNNSSNHPSYLYGPPPVGASWLDMFDCKVFADGLKVSVA